MTGVSKGFEISLHHQGHILRIRAWGVWDTEMATKFENTFQEKMSELSASEKTWCLLADFTQFPLQIEAVQRMICQQILTAEKQGLQKIGYLGENSGIQVQFTGLFQTSNRPRYAFFESEAEAIGWLLRSLHDEVTEVQSCDRDLT
jgi:hypothetical protein